MHSIYKITVRGKDYYGYTSRSPLVRLDEHLDNSRKRIKSKFYNALRANNFKCQFEVIGRFKTEVEALIKEIELIAKNKNGLNTSPGGEGKTIQVSIVDGKVVVEPRKKRRYLKITTRPKKNRNRRRRRWR